MAREKIIALGKKMTDRIPYKLGLEKLTESDPEYYGLECVVTDDEADVALAMDLRKPTTPEKLAAKMGKRCCLCLRKAGRSGDEGRY